MFNKIILVGNLTRDIELRYSQSGSAIAKSAIATSRKFTVNGERREEVCFVDITFFGRSGEIANQFLRKGSKVLVEGRLNFEQWVDQNGQKRSKHSVIVESMQMLDSKGDNPSQQPQQNASYQNNGSNYGNYPQQQNNQYQQNSYSQPQQTQPTQQMDVPKEPEIPEIDIDEDEIPF